MIGQMRGRRLQARREAPRGPWEGSREDRPPSFEGSGVSPPGKFVKFIIQICAF
jgi:hypothetical protein